MSAPKRNQNAKNGKDWKDAIKYAIKAYESSDVKRGEALKSLAKKLITKGLDGDLPSIKEIGDRLDGRPAQTTIIEDDDNRDIEEFNIDELQQMLSDSLREEAIEAKKKEQTNGINTH